MFCLNHDSFTSHPIDLSEMSLALVGGHRKMHRSVLLDLKQCHGLHHGVAIPPMHERSINRIQVKHLLRNCDLIAIVTGYASHTISAIVFNLVRSGKLHGQIVLITSRGKNGVLREVLSHFDLLLNQTHNRLK